MKTPNAAGTAAPPGAAGAALNPANVDLEYVLLPRNYKAPGRELFGLLEISALHNTSMRSFGISDPRTGGTQLMLAPGLQYVASRRMVIEASWQAPIVANAKELQLRNRWNLLIGIRWLF